MPDSDFDIGRMRSRVLLQARPAGTVEAEPGGDELVEWLDVGTYRAEVVPLTGRELFNAQQAKASTDYRIRMRQVKPVAPLKYRFVYKGFPLYPDSVIRVDGRNEFFEILATSMQDEVP